MAKFDVLNQIANWKIENWKLTAYIRIVHMNTYCQYSLTSMHSQQNIILLIQSYENNGHKSACKKLNDK